MNKSKSLRFSKSIIAVAVISMCGAGSLSAQESSETNKEVIPEEIVVTGIRASLEKAANLKQNDSRILLLKISASFQITILPKHYNASPVYL